MLIVARRRRTRGDVRGVCAASVAAHPRRRNASERQTFTMKFWPLLIVALWASSSSPDSNRISSRARPPVRPGLEVLLTDSMQLVRDRRVGLVTNRAGIDRAGIPAAVRLRAAGVRVVALFSPEHGFGGTAAPGEAVTTSTD